MQFMPLTRTPVTACLALMAYPLLVCATYWTVTSYFELDTSTSQFDTYTRTVKPGVSPTVSPISVSTEVNSYEQLTIVYVYLPVGAVAEDDIQTTTTFVAQNAMTVYMEPLVYTAPASCPTPFTVTTMVEVQVPTEVSDLVTPTSITTSVANIGDLFIEVTAYLPPSAVPTTAATTDDVYMAYIAYCQNPTATGSAYWGPSGGISGGNFSGGGDDFFTWWVIVLASVIPSVFLLGYVESFLWFRQLMLGKMALRPGNVCWTLLFCLVPLWYTRTSPARSAEDQAALKIQWDAMSAVTRWKLWWKWGFTPVYPVDLLGFNPRLPHRMLTVTGFSIVIGQI